MQFRIHSISIHKPNTSCPPSLPRGAFLFSLEREQLQKRGDRGDGTFGTGERVTGGNSKDFFGFLFCQPSRPIVDPSAQPGSSVAQICIGPQGDTQLKSMALIDNMSYTDGTWKLPTGEAPKEGKKSTLVEPYWHPNERKEYRKKEQEESSTRVTGKKKTWFRRKSLAARKKQMDLRGQG